MIATWYLVKYMADPRRQEPRNVGLILQHEDGWRTRFAGERADGRIDGRGIRGFHLDLEVYVEWVEYYRKKAQEAAWSDVTRLESRGRRGNFYTALGGQSFSDTRSPEQLLDDLFRELVQDDQVLRERVVRKVPLTTVVHEIFRRVEVEPMEHVRVPARYSTDGRLTEVSFRYALQNGQLHLMEELGIPQNMARALEKARELRARMEAARLAGSSDSFVVFYSGSQGPETTSDLEEVLLPLEDQAQTVDVDNTESATEMVEALVRQQLPSDM